MKRYQEKTLIEMALFVLEQTGGTDIYHLLKILYFAELKHVAKWGARMTDEDFRAYKYGPVARTLHNAFKGMGAYRMIELFDAAIDKDVDDAQGILLAKRSPDMDYISEAARECLLSSISENINLSFDELKNKSHDAVWKRIWHCYGDGGSDKIGLTDMAEAAGVGEEMMSYIAEMAEMEEYLLC